MTTTTDSLDLSYFGDVAVAINSTGVSDSLDLSYFGDAVYVGSGGVTPEPTSNPNDLQQYICF